MKAYDAKDAADFLDKKTDYWKITEGYYYLGGELKHFGVPESSYREEKVINSLAHKQLVRKHLDSTIKSPLPKNEEDRNRVIAFQIFAFENAKTLVGTGESEPQKELYKSFIQSAAEKSNILPLIFMKELAGISFKEMFQSEEVFSQFVAKVTNPQIAEYLNTEVLSKDI
jgi:hypothetical protein